MRLQDLPKRYDRTLGKHYMDAVACLFLEHFQSYGCQKQEPINITSGADQTVHFIGAAISAVKPFIIQKKIPKNGLVIAQPSLRSRNVNKLLQDDFCFEWGACFTNIELVAHYEDLDTICAHTFAFFNDVLNVGKNNMVVRVSTKNMELDSLCRKYARDESIQRDGFPEKYYTHSIGMPQYQGKNFNFALKHSSRDDYKDVGNFIVFSDQQDVPQFIEVGFGDTTILKELYGLDHILDCFPIADIECANKNDRHIIEDTIIASTALVREGLMPSSKSAQSKILYKYIRALQHVSQKNHLGRDVLEPMMRDYEVAMYDEDRGCAKKIFDFIEEKKTIIENLNSETIQKLQNPQLKRI